jgi:hypothetical protein
MAAAGELFELAEASPDDSELYLDTIARLPMPLARQAVRFDAEAARQMVESMATSR